jgi:FixJ family two-component response regulator
VYIVDNDPALRDLVRRTVESLALDAVCFTSGQQFLAQYDGSRVSCLVTDLKTPDLTDQQLLEVLAERRSTIPTIIISGHGNIPAAVRAMAIGAIAFLENPCGLDTLRHTVRRAIELARKRHQAAAPEIANKDRPARRTNDESAAMQMIANSMPDNGVAAGQDVDPRTV